MNTFWKRAAIIFVLVQVLGLICTYIVAHAPPASYSALAWATGFIACFPGGILASVLTEKLLWKSSLSLQSMWLVSLPIILLINAILWAAVLSAFRAFFGRRPAQSVRNL